MREVRTGVWHWEAPHPDWPGPENEALRRRLAGTATGPNQAARGVVSSYAIEDDERLLLFDPLAVPRELEERAAGREQVVVLTCPWHERGTRELAQRFGVPVFTPAPDEDGPDLAWLVGGDMSAAHLYAAGDRLPVGVEALPGRLPDDVVLWVESRRAVIFGDTLVDFGRGLEIPPEWLPDGVTPRHVADALRPLLDLPVDVVLATHGGPTDRSDLERALS
jgi:glyoxylase-like metal-dependent hydrolase (beta-lactamase superfamily II)